MLGLLVAAPASAVAAPAPLGLTQCGSAQGVYQCSGLVATWDGVPLDTTVTLPAEGASGLPLVAEIHGFGNSKYEYLDPDSTAYTDNAFAWARAGYAVLTYTARGLWGSCGTPESRAASAAACARGYIHLADARYEVRDTQELIGRLVDGGVVDPARIGVTGDSYGGGQSTALAALRNRVMLPDGTLEPWRSPAGTPLSIAAAAPVIPWTDLVYAIAPNGRTLTYAIPGADDSTTPVGVFKQTFANGIFAAAQFAVGPGQPVGEPFVQGRPMGYLAPPGTDPDADVAGWVSRADAGEPYDDASGKAVVDTLERYHSPYSIDPSVAPPPLFVASGFTDDLFPIDEALRFVNRVRRDHPSVPVAMMLGDFGHQRASNKKAERARLIRRVHDWMDRFLMGKGSVETGVEASTQTCPREAPSEGPFSAPTFAGLARGEVRLASADPRTFTQDGGDPQVGAAIDPVGGGGNACATTGAADQAGTATYRLPAATGAGYTLLGAPTIVARLKVTGQPGVAQAAGRLWDVAPDGSSQTLVARGVYRPAGSGGDEVWQLHANGWRFAAGHVPKLELLGSDAPSSRSSNGSFSVEVERLELRLPVRERPDGAVVQQAAPPVVPAGQTPVAGQGRGSARPRLRLRLRCTARGTRASATVARGRARRVDFFARGRLVARDRRRPFTRIVLRPGRTRHRVRISARAAIKGGRSVRAVRSTRGCPRRHSR
ncbi:MAG: type transport system ATP-binding protein [Thermoleophilaceae bacterium]|nr:type transport system ATP-binding protein [Thermoleophilaceae bacterium]